MNLDFLDKRGTRKLGYILGYLIDPDLIEHLNPSLKSFAANEENWKETTIAAIKHLTEEDKQELIDIMGNKPKLISEAIRVFKDFEILEEKEGIADFLYDLMKKTNGKKCKLEIFSLIYLNCPEYALKIIFETKQEVLKKELCESCISSNAERGYIYTLLNNVDIKIFNELNTGELVNEINYIQYFHREPILEKIFIDYRDKDELIREINNKLRDNDFETFYTLAKNIRILDSYNFNINKKELELLKWIVNTIGEKDFIEMAKVKNFDTYTSEWLIFISMNLLKRDIQEQELSIIVLDHLIGREGFIENYGSEVGEEISLFINENIKENKEMSDHLLRILRELKSENGFYNIMDLINEEGVGLVKKRGFKKYIDSQILYTREFKWLSALEEKQIYTKAKFQPNVKALTFALMNKTPIANYGILNLLKHNDKNLYLEIMKNYEEVIDNKLDGYEKCIKLLIVLNYIPQTKNVLDTVKEYESENLGIIEAFIKICDPDLIEKYHISRVQDALLKGDTNIVDMLQEIRESHIKAECSYLVIEDLIEEDFEEIINIWEHLSLDIEGTMKFREMVLQKLKNNEIQLNETNINFINEIGINPGVLYSLIDGESNKHHLFDIWHESNEFGKIINVIRNDMISNAKSLDDLDKINDLIKDYNINDHSIDTLVKIKAYTMINIELLKLDIRDENSKNRLDEIGFQIISYELVERFLTDKFLQNELDKGIVDYLFRKFIDSASSDELWKYYWENIMEDVRFKHHNIDNGKMEIFFNHLSKSKKGIEWFLDIMDSQDIENEIQISIIEILLMLINKQNRIILQNQQEIDQIEGQTLINVGKIISKPLSNMEKTIINRTNDVENDILIENLKRFRRGLKDIGIDTVEDINNYGKPVEFDNTIHENTFVISQNRGIVDSLGIKVNGKILILGTLLNID